MWIRGEGTIETDMEDKNENVTETKNDGKKSGIAGKILKGARIEHSISGSRLVMDCKIMNYKLRMLETNKIPGLLPLEITENDGVKQICYDITSGEAFGSFGTARTLKMEDVRNMLYEINHTLGSIGKYLLDPDELVLDKDFIYVHGSSVTPRLCYLPGYASDFSSGLSTLLQDMLGMVDHSDHDAVVMAYSLYQESLKPGYVITDIIRILNGENAANKDSVNTEDRKNGDNDRNSDKTSDKEPREKTTDELFIQYQVPSMQQAVNTPGKSPAKTAAENKDAIFNAVSKPNRRRYATIFSR